MKKIGILTFNNSYNYGALLQAYATIKFLKLKNFDVKFINYVNKYEHKWNKLFSYRKKLSIKDNLVILIKNIFFGNYYYNKKSFKNFINSLPKSEKLNKKRLINYNKFDILIAGSDQIWNPNIYGGDMDTTFLLDFSTTSKKISFASSFGSYKLNSSEKKVFKRCLKDFSFVGVREDFGVSQIKKLGIENVKKVCDPTMLLSSDEWRTLIKSEVIESIDEPYLVVYLMSKYEDYANQIKKIADYYSLKIVFVTFSNLKRKYVDFYAKGYTPFQFLKLIQNSNLVLTNSFHGTVFSILLNKEFINLENTNNPERVKTLLNHFDLSNRIIKKDDDIDKTLSKINVINYAKINEKIDYLSTDSKQALLNAIDF